MTASVRRRRSERLPADVRATWVDLHFELDPLQSHYRGTASYTLELDRRRRSLEFHSVDLRVAFVRLHLGREILHARVERIPERESVRLHFDRLIPSGSVHLDLSFRGRIRRDLRGLYAAGSGEEAWLATQLCPTDARRFFPCFDEPGMKARYTIRVTAPNAQTVISNSPIESEHPAGEGRKTVQFETTPPLSTYLVAIAVGPFEASPVTMSGATAIRVFTLPGKRKLGAFARQAACESLERLERWFDMPHPYPKLDLLALPAFAFGAMENAGAIFFRDSILLLDAENASAEDRKRSAEVIAHELSHMWFGNWVTMAWWNDLWLNEAFATWMAYLIVDDWRPEWRIWLDFAHRREYALVKDALSSSHAIAPPIRSAEEAQENFDAITYSKGASVLRMLERYLGPEAFRDGIRLYIRRHGEANAEAADLWAALAEVSGQRIEAIVSPWTLQTGYPLVTLEEMQTTTVPTIILRQERFLALSPRSSRKDDPKWQIPWVARTGRDKNPSRSLRRLLSKHREILPSTDLDFDWIYANEDEAGFFRVDYGDAETQRLIAHVSDLSAMERIGFIGNQWALCRSGRVRIESLLDLLAALRGEEDPDVLSAIESALSPLCERLAPRVGPEVEHQLRFWIADTFGPQIDVVGLSPRPNEDDRRRLARSRIFSLVGRLGLADSVVRKCERDCTRHFAEATLLPAELAEIILRIAARKGDATLHDAMREASTRADTPQTRRIHLLGLGEFASQELIAKSLDVALDPAAAPPPDRAQLIGELLARPHSAAQTWARVREDWKRLEKQLPPIVLARLAAATADGLPPEDAGGILDFFRRHPLAAGSRVLSQIAEELKITGRFERSAGPALAGYLGG